MNLNRARWRVEQNDAIFAQVTHFFGDLLSTFGESTCTMMSHKKEKVIF